MDDVQNSWFYMEVSYLKWSQLRADATVHAENSAANESGEGHCIEHFLEVAVQRLSFFIVCKTKEFLSCPSDQMDIPFV